MRFTTARVINLANGHEIITLSETQFSTLRDHLEQESEADSNFSITAEMIEDLRQEGVDFASAFAAALGEATELAAGYEPLGGFGSAAARGRLLDLKTFDALVGYKVEIYDRGLAFDHLLGWCYTDAQGRFEYRFDQARGEAEYDIELRVLDFDGKRSGSVGSLSDFQANFGDVFVSSEGEMIAPIFDPNAAAICSNCGALYKAGVDVCNDCQRPVQRLDEVPVQTAAQSRSQPKMSEAEKEAIRIRQKPMCPECGIINRRGSDFCRKCGYPFSLGTFDPPKAI